MATRYQHLQARELVARRRGFEEGIAAAAGKLGAAAAAAWLTGDQTAEEIRDWARDVAEIRWPDGEPMPRVFDRALEALRADDVEWEPPVEMAE